MTSMKTGFKLSTRLAPALLFAWLMTPAAWGQPAACGSPNGVAVQVLGSGGPIADDGRASSAYLVWVEGNSRVLIDSGGGAFLRFGEAGGDFEALDFVGISHFHADHSADLPALLKSGYFSHRSRPLHIAGPAAGRAFPGLEEFLNGLLDSDRGVYRYLGGYRDGSDGMPRLAVLEIGTAEDGMLELSELDAPGFRVDALHVPHGIVPTVAFRIRIGDTSIVFGSDQTGADPAFIDFAKNADLLIMHMAIPLEADSVARKLHASPEGIGTTASKSAARTLLLSHFMARSLRDLEQNVSAVRAAYGGRIMLAEDLLCIELAAKP